MDHERESLRQTYQLCRLGFAILAVSLLLACPASIVSLFILLGNRSIAVWLAGHTWWWRWSDTLVVWGCLVGTYLLWGRWSDSGWQRRVGLLIVMSLADVVLWALNQSDVLNLELGEIGHRWLRDHLGQALGWAEFALLASLAGDVMAHLGVASAREASKATRSLAATGAVIWMVLFCQQTIWRRGWPLQGPRHPSLQSILLDLGSTMIWAITLIQVTGLTMAATRETGRALAEMDQEDRRDDLFRSPSETDADLIPTGSDRSPHAPKDSDSDRFDF
jgi:hypothetical protein